MLPFKILRKLLMNKSRQKWRRMIKVLLLHTCNDLLIAYHPVLHIPRSKLTRYTELTSDFEEYYTAPGMYCFTVYHTNSNCAEFYFSGHKVPCGSFLRISGEQGILRIDCIVVVLPAYQQGIVCSKWQPCEQDLFPSHWRITQYQLQPAVCQTIHLSELLAKVRHC